MRLSFGHMVAYGRTGRLGYLFGAKRMLDHYVVRHEEVFGDGEAARAARGQAYEILHQVESLIETPPADVPESADDSAVDHIDDGDDDDRSVAEDDEPSRSPRGPRRRADAVVEDDEGLHRTVVVKRRHTADIDDLALRQALVEWNPDPNAPPVLTRPGVQEWIPARAYVRVDGVPKLLGSAASPIAARQLAADVVSTVRSQLRACYEGAYARAPADYRAVQLELSVADAGTITRAEIRGGGLGDAIGDACVLGRLEQVQLDRKALGGSTGREPPRLAIDLLFFYDETVFMGEAHGRVPTALDPPAEDPAAEPHG